MNKTDEKTACWNTLTTTELLVRDPWLSIYQERVRLPTGRVVDDFYRIALPSYVIVVPFTENDEIVLVRGYKHGPRRVSLCAPAGMIEPNESPLQAAQRELLEETGHTAESWTCLGSFVTDANRQCGTAFVFLASQSRKISEPQHDDEMERLEVVRSSPISFFSAVRQGDVALIPVIAAVSLAIVTKGLCSIE